MWVTSAETGITRYNPATDDYKHFEQQPYTVSYNIDTLTKIAEGGGLLWIKMNNWGFGYYDRDRDEVEPFYNESQTAQLPDDQRRRALRRARRRAVALDLPRTRPAQGGDSASARRGLHARFEIPESAFGARSGR